MDHQWGNFQTYKDGGWDWFSMQLDDQTEVMLYLIRNAAGEVVLVDGSAIDSDGTLTVLEAKDVSVEATGSWRSPASGTTYPSGWVVRLPAEDLSVRLTPSLENQELDTTASTGVTYWEGEVTLQGTRRGKAVGGLGYVELTGYSPVREVGRP